MPDGSAISKKSSQRLLAQLEIHPVLVDVGASDAPPLLWDLIAPQSIYVGFDPDKREIHELTGERFHKSIMVNEAVTASETESLVTFYLTRSPYCSSTLFPDHAALDDYLFADLFDVERTTESQTTTLNSVIERFGLTSIDWLKLDTQGTDLRIFNSLSTSLRSHVLALDIEPGLIDAYIGEDLFIDVHHDLLGQGFWLSRLDMHGTVRLSQSALKRTLAGVVGMNTSVVSRTVRTSPGWCEARYLRTVDTLDKGDYGSREYSLHWLFALLDGQIGFALDLGTAYERRFGAGPLAQLMQQEPLRMLRGTSYYRMCLLASKAIKSMGRTIWKMAR